MASNRDWIKRRRQCLMRQQDNKCMYCGCELIYFQLANHESMPPNFATIEHMNDRFSFRRIATRGRKKTLGVACSKCNVLRSRHHQKRFRLLLWYKSKSYPRILTLFIPILYIMGYLIEQYIKSARRFYQAQYDLRLYLYDNR